MRSRPALRRVILTLLATAALLPDRARAQDDAYRDEGARELVRQARIRRNTVDLRIQAYSTIARERFTAALRAGIAEKIVYRRETATEIDWHRDGPVRMAILGMREVAPLFDATPAVPDDLSAELLRLAFDPVGTDLFMRGDSTGLRHPLAHDSEEHYRFASGDTTRIRLPDGREVRLLELRVTPRRSALNLLHGSFWFDADTHAVVQVYVRPAAAFDAATDAGSIAVAQSASEDRDTTNARDTTNVRSITLNDIGRFVQPMRAEVDYIAIEYGLWDLQWWLPRRLAARGHILAGRVRVPLTYERTYEAYSVAADPTPAPAAGVVARPPSCSATVQYETTTAGAATDSARQATTDRERARRARMAAARDSVADVPPCTRTFILTAPSDSALLHSDDLPPSIFGDDIALISHDELSDIADRLRSLPAPPASFERPRLHFPPFAPGLLRYNPVEGLSIGARLLADRGSHRLSAEARIGIPEAEPRGELALERHGTGWFTRPAVYRRLEPAHPHESVPGLVGSLAALLFSRSDRQYFDATGAELLFRPADPRSQWFDFRVYAERQRAVENSTDFSALHLVNDRNTFRPNFTADAADQIGARLRLRAAHGRNPRAPRLAGEISLSAETGDYRILRPEALLRFSTPLAGSMALGLEAAAGTVEGSAVPAQALWRLGGAATLRGYAGSSVVGERYWRGRAELGFGMPAARLSLFSDVGWAGPRNRFDAHGAVRSIGIGGSFLDGLVRLDLARGLDAPRDWRVYLHIERL